MTHLIFGRPSMGRTERVERRISVQSIVLWPSLLVVWPGVNYYPRLPFFQATSLKTRINSILRAVLSSSLLVVGLSNAFAGSTLERIKRTGVVNLGFREESLPFSYKNAEQGAPLGYSIEVCNALVESIKQELRLASVEIKYVPVTGATRMPHVVEGKIDMECANSTNTKARREQVAFSMPLYFSSAKLLVREGSGITKIADLAGKTLAVQKGTTGFLIAESRQQTMKTMKVALVETSAAGAAAVENKTADAFMTDDILLYGFKGQSKEALAVVGPTISIEPLAIMFSKTDSELATLIEREMAQLYTSGRLRKVYQKWFQTTLPQRSFNLNVSPNQLTSDMFNHPSSYAVDWVIF